MPNADLVDRLAKLPNLAEIPREELEWLAAHGNLGVRPAGWEQATGDYGKPGHRSIADVVDDDSRLKVREHKKSVKAAAKG